MRGNPIMIGNSITGKSTKRFPCYRLHNTFGGVTLGSGVTLVVV